MQINGRLQFDLKLDDKDYTLLLLKLILFLNSFLISTNSIFSYTLNCKICGNIYMKENILTDVDKEAEIIANRIIEKVRQKSLNKSINKSVQHKYESQSATKFSQTEHFKSIEQSNSRQETLKNDYKQPYISEYQSDFRSSFLLFIFSIIITPQKHKQRNTKSQQCIKKDQSNHKQSAIIQLAESQYIIENNSNCNIKDGKQIIQLIDNAHNLIRKNSQILNKVQLQSPLQSVINTKSLNTQINKKKEDIVTQLLGSLRNAKKIKDEYQKRFF